jgi:HD superfamily phosphodiesterase
MFTIKLFQIQVETMDLHEIERMTGEYGEGWALAHCHRLLKLIDRISEGVTYDKEVMPYAVYLHDWGAFPHFRRSGVEHALRSREVVEAEILPQLDLTAAQKKVILEAIEYHDYRCTLSVWSQEAILLREADFLDFLGAIGIAREFSWGPNNLRQSYQRILARRDGIRGHFSLPAARQIAEERLNRMEKVLNWIQEESLGDL